MRIYAIFKTTNQSEILSLLFIRAKRNERECLAHHSSLFSFLSSLRAKRAKSVKQNGTAVPFCFPLSPALLTFHNTKTAHANHRDRYPNQYRVCRRRESPNRRCKASRFHRQVPQCVWFDSHQKWYILLRPHRAPPLYRVVKRRQFLLHRH